MAIKHLTHIDLSKNQLQNAVIHPLGADPSGVEGQIYYNSTAGIKKLYLHDGTSFKPVGNITTVASTTSQLVVTGGTTGTVSLALSLASSLSNGDLGLVTADMVYDYIAAGSNLVNSISAGTGISVNASTGAVTITNTDLGSSQSIFKNIAVSGQSTVVADTNNDTLTFVAGSNVTITTDAVNDTITISSTDTNTTYVAGSGITLTGNSFGHTNIITAGNFGDSGITRSLAFGGTFIVPYVTYDINGHVVSKSNLTLTMPSNPDTYPTTFAWTGGTTAGPTGSLTGTSATVSYPAIPSASASASGIVTTNGQTFAGDKTFANNIVITGNLTVNGTTTTVNTETISLADNIITLNSNFTTGTPTENGGIEILRGASPTTSLVWNETTDRWTFTNDGTTFFNIPISGDATDDSYATDLTATSGAQVVTHNLNSSDIIVQLYDKVTFETIYSDIVRTTVNSVTITFVTAPTNAVRVLIQKID